MDCSAYVMISKFLRELDTPPNELPVHTSPLFDTVEDKEVAQEGESRKFRLAVAVIERTGRSMLGFA
jgi:hypothetical protein